MLRIPCPYCGLRDQMEFTYGGDASVPRPTNTYTTDNKKWDDYLYFRDNPAGKHQEYWQHTLGCRQWFRLVRDTVTNAILEAPRGNPEDEV